MPDLDQERLPPQITNRSRAWARVERLLEAVSEAERAALTPSPGDPEDRARDKFEGALTSAVASLASKRADFGTIADLRDADLSRQADGSLVTVAGYYSENDGGGGEFRIDRSDTTSADDGGSVIVTDGGIRLKAVFDRDAVEAVRFGAIPANVGEWRNVNTSIQKAIDYCHARNGGTVVLRGINTINGTIVLKKNVSLVSNRQSPAVDNPTWDWTQPNFLGGCGASLFGGANMNAPLLEFDGSDGLTVRSNVATWDGELVAAQKAVNATVRGIFFHRNSQQTVYAPLVRARSLWGITIEYCLFTSSSEREYMLHLRDLNYLRFNCNQVGGGGRGVLFDDIADSEVRDNFCYYSIGPVVTLLGSWKNVITGNQIGNAVTTGLTGVAGRFTFTASGNVLTAASHRLETGGLVYLSSSGTLPSGVVATRPYYAIKLTNNTFSVASTYANALAGTAVTLSTAGSGTHTASFGPAVGLFCLSGGGSNQGASTISCNRVDQCLEQSYLFWDWRSSAIVGNYAVEGGYLGATDFPAFEFANGTRNCVIHGNACDEGTASYLFKVGANCDYLDIAGYSGSGTSGTFDISATGTSNCRIGVSQTPAGLITATTLAAGTASAGTVAALHGNAGGARVLTLERTSGLTSKVGLGVVTDGFNFWNETQNTSIALLISTTGAALFTLGGPASATPKPSAMQGQDGSGSNISGGSLSLNAGAGTGNATPAAVNIKVPAATTSGSSAQAVNIRFAVSEPASPVTNDTCAIVYFYDGAAWQSKRVLVGAADSDGVGFRTLRVSN